MAGGKEFKAIISIAGTIDPSLGRAISSAVKQTGGLGTALRGAGTVAGVGAAAIGAATTAVVAFGKSAVTAGMSFDTAMSNVAATMGTTTDQIGNLTEFAMHMGEATIYSATECAEALNYMALAGYDAETSMKMLPNVLNLAAAGSMDLARASDMVTDTQTAFGISIERTSLLVDEMAKAASTGNTSVEQLGDAFLTVGGLVQELNGGFVDLNDGADQWVDGTQEMEIALTAMANAGIKGEQAGTHMRNMLLKLSSPTAEGAKQMEALGVSAFDAEGKMRSLNSIFGDLNTAFKDLTQEQKIQAISDLFNARDIASSEALLNAVSQDWDKIGASILDAKIKLDDVQSAIEQTSVDFSKYTGDAQINVRDLSADIRQDLTTSGMSAQEAARDIAEAYDMSFMDATKAVNSVIDALHEAQGAAEQMANEKTDNLEGDISRFNSALEYTQIIVSSRLSPSLREFVQFGTDGLKSITEAFRTGGLSGAMDELGNVISQGLAKLTEVAPQAVQAGMQLMLAITQGIVDNMPQLITTGIMIAGMLIQGVMQALPQLASSLGNALVQTLSSVISPQAGTIMQQIIDVVSQAGEAVAPMIEGLVSSFMEIGPQIAEALMPAIEAVVNMLPSIVELLTSVLGALMPIIENSMQFAPQIVEIISQIIQALAPLVQYLAGELANSVQQLAPMIANVLNQIMPLLMQLLTGILPPLIQLLSALMPILQLLFTILNPLLELLNTLLSAIMPLIISAVQRTIEWLTMLVNYLTANFTTVLQGLVPLVESVITPIIAHWQALLDFINNVFLGQWSAAWENVKTISSNAFNGLAGIAKAAFNAVLSVINGAISALNQIHVKIPAAFGFPGLDLQVSIPQIPLLAHGGFTNGPSIAGEAGQEAVISFDPSVRQKNLSYWAQAGKLLGVNSQAVDTVAAGAKASGASAGNSITFSPNVTIQGNADYDTVMQALRDNEEEFMDMLNEFLLRKESVSYG